MIRFFAAGIVVVVSALFTFYTYYELQKEQPQAYRNPRRIKHKKSERIIAIKQEIEERRLICAICMQRCRFSQKIWFCNECANPYHINDCLIQWIEKAKRPECPSCKNIVKTPIKHTCMCGRQDNPKSDMYNPFSCGQNCRRCNDECHPGSCF